MSFGSTRSPATSTSFTTPSTSRSPTRCGWRRTRASPSGSPLRTFDAGRSLDRAERHAETAARRDHAVDETVGDGLLGRHEVVAVDVVHDLVHRPSTVVGDDLGHPL